MGQQAQAGHFSSRVLATVTRVVMGHSGQNPETDATTWLLIPGFEITA